MILRIKVIRRIPFVLSAHSIVTYYCVTFVLKTPHSIVSSYRILFIFYRALNLLSSNGVFVRDVKAAMLMTLDKETGGHVDLQTNLSRIALYFYADKLFNFVYSKTFNEENGLSCFSLFFQSILFIHSITFCLFLPSSAFLGRHDGIVVHAQ